jgi:hypothetical protein
MDERICELFEKGREYSRYKAGSGGECWATRNMFCLSCDTNHLHATKTNEPVVDFYCGSCHEPYQLKTSMEPFTTSAAGGSYQAMVNAVRQGRTPNFLLLHYDPNDLRILELHALHRRFVSGFTIEKAAKPVKGRDGYYLFSLDLASIPRRVWIPVIKDGAGLSPRRVRSKWEPYVGLKGSSGSSGWFADIVWCVSQLDRDVFRTRDLYQFERVLAKKHPKNNRIKAKIRQQLQDMGEAGLARPVKRGIWEIVP